MSFHNHDKFPEYNHDAILSGLRAHGLSLSEPSQLSDAFRSGYKYAEIEIERLRDSLRKILNDDMEDLSDARFLAAVSLGGAKMRVILEGKEPGFQQLKAQASQVSDALIDAGFMFKRARARRASGDTCEIELEFDMPKSKERD